MRPLVHSALVVLAISVTGCAASVSLDEPVTAAGAAIDSGTETPDAAPDAPTPHATADVTAPPADAPTPAATAATPTATPPPEPTVLVDSTPAPTDGPTPTAAAAPSPTPMPTPPTPTPTPTATPTPTSPAIAIPTPTPTPVAIEFVIAPDAPLLGVALGTTADDALAALTSRIGPPDFDSDWRVGCPLDGEELDERLVQWGDLNVYFDRSDGDELFVTWGYDLRIVEGGYPEIELIQLPGGARMGQPIEDVAAAAGLSVEYDELFDVNRVSEPGFEIVADGSAGSPVWGAFVPSIPLCE